MITILCSGSRGDIQPYIALAVELKKLGKNVRIAAGNSFEGFITEYGIECFPLSADLNSVDVDPKLIEAAQTSDNPLKMLLTFNKMKKYALFMTDEMYSACEGSELIIYHPGCTIGYFAAQIMGIPSVLASPFPMHKTKEFASVIAYGKSKMPIALSYKLLQTMLWTASKTGAKTCLKKKFNKLPSNFGPPYEKLDKAHQAVISCSNFVFKRPEDWNENIHQYGYWFLNESEDFVPPKELKEFLESGDKPIYFGFGSVFREEEKEHILGIIKEALNKSKKRGIICGMGKVNGLPENIIALESIPHSWLFNRVLAVCHHGGAGTTAEGFRAGVPSIIMPFSNDQFAWAHRSYDIGVGSKPLNKKKLTVEMLSEAIEFTLSPDVVAKAKELGQNIVIENGAKYSASVIQKMME